MSKRSVRINQGDCALSNSYSPSTQRPLPSKGGIHWLNCARRASCVCVLAEARTCVVLMYLLARKPGFKEDDGKALKSDELSVEGRRCMSDLIYAIAKDAIAKKNQIPTKKIR